MPRYVISLSSNPHEICDINMSGKVKLQKGSHGYQTAEQISLEQIRKKNEEALIELSANKLSVIISGLAEGLDALSKVHFLKHYFSSI